MGAFALCPVHLLSAHGLCPAGLQFTRQRLSQRLLVCAQQGLLVRVKNSFKVRGLHACNVVLARL